MRPLVLLLIVTGTAASVRAQTQKSGEALEYEQRIQKLEERVAFLERALTEVLARNPQAPVLAEAPAPSHVASTPVRTSGYEPPPWLWGIDTNERRRLGARRLLAPHGRGLAGSLLLPQLLYVLAIRF